MYYSYNIVTISYMCVVRVPVRHYQRVVIFRNHFTCAYMGHYQRAAEPEPSRFAADGRSGKPIPEPMPTDGR